jgi:NADH dehydrogenase [ubiquinone] 1 alpha subcomplex assembly factor 7
MVASDGENLRFALTPDAVPKLVIPASLRDAALGSVIELNLGATEIVGSIAERIVKAGDLALIIDYGHTATATGDTLQAVKGNAFAYPLTEPGEADLTTHVDFAALATAAREAGAHIRGPLPQGDFLSALGLHARTSRLKRDNPEKASEIEAAVERLTSPQQMGTLFKAMAIFEGADQIPPPGFND